MAGKYFKLNEDHTTEEVSLFEWAELYEGNSQDRVVKQEKIIEGVEVSTVFLGLDYSFVYDSEPILFETLIMGGEFDGDMDRYTTWDEAVKGHKKIVSRCKAEEWERNEDGPINNRFDILDL